MWHLVATLRLCAILVVLLIGAMLGLFIRWMRPALFSWIAVRWNRVLAWLIGMRLRIDGEGMEQAALVVSNHISWADVIVIGTRWPLVFLAMAEVQRWPVIGWLARRAGTLFIQRGSGSSSATEQVAEVLEKGRSVVIFPEGRTTSGVSVNRFHARLFEAAVRAEVPVVPVAITYRDQNRPPNSASRINFADSVGFVGNIWRTLAGPPIEARLRVFPALTPESGRQQLATRSQQLVSEHVAMTLASPHS